ncbi:diguanylate cyclase [Kosmotoga pacifica]|uniref:diguanylate cyclase n=1 Tax=Kosmotoga pacifica TaxID=1330330 RepID=UPI000A91EF15|nr:diguanylate cyclase [Kosmotoga pacifica]
MISPKGFNLGEAFLIVDKVANKIVFANRLASNSLGTPLDRLLNSSIDELETSFSCSQRVFTSKKKDFQEELCSEIIDTGKYLFLFLKSKTFKDNARGYSSPISIVTIEADTTISRVSGSFEELTGYAKWEIENKKSFLEFIPPGMRNMLKDLYILRRTRGYSFSDEYALEILRKDGSTRSVLINIEFIETTNQSIIFVLDISAQKEKETFLRKRLDFANNLSHIILKMLSMKGPDILHNIFCELEKKKEILGYEDVFIFLRGKSGAFKLIEGKGDKNNEIRKYAQFIIESLREPHDLICLPYDPASVSQDVVLPIFTNRILYGVILLHKLRNEVAESPESLGALETLGRVVSFCIEIARSTRAMKEQNEKMQLVLKFHNSGTWEAEEREGEVFYLKDPHWLKALGYNEEEVEEIDWNELIDARDRIALKKGISQYVTGETDSYRVKYRVINNWGGVEWFQDEGKFYESPTKGKILVGIRKKMTSSVLTWEKLKYVSLHDRLTSLYNRLFFEEEMKRLDTERQVPLSVVMGDVNGLKLVNDAFGHEKGDELLKKTADILRNAVRKEDVVARWGGDEFIILLPKADEEIARCVCERIRMGCSQKLVVENIVFDISLGYSTRNNLDKSIPVLIKEAEDLMYRNKVLESNRKSRNVLTALENTLFEYNFIEAEHCRRVENLALYFGKYLGFYPTELSNLRLLARFHDIGILAVPSNILMKPDKLDKAEWKVVKTHPEVGFRIARSTLDLSAISEEILAHHENWDGTGYPGKLKKKQIPYLARVITIINAFEAMTGFRPYRKSSSFKEALEELKKCTGSQFDPELSVKFIDFISGVKNINSSPYDKWKYNGK